jgi:hypothetical protein
VCDEIQRKIQVKGRRTTEMEMVTPRDHYFIAKGRLYSSDRADVRMLSSQNLRRGKGEDAVMEICRIQAELRKEEEPERDSLTNALSFSEFCADTGRDSMVREPFHRP